MLWQKLAVHTGLKNKVLYLRGSCQVKHFSDFINQFR
jgi:hypothetical protein